MCVCVININNIVQYDVCVCVCVCVCVFLLWITEKEHVVAICLEWCVFVCLSVSVCECVSVGGAFGAEEAWSFGGGDGER